MMRLLFVLTMLLAGCKDQCSQREVEDCARKSFECQKPCFQMSMPGPCMSECREGQCRCLEKANCRGDCSYKASCTEAE